MDPIDIHRLDQALAKIQEHVVPTYASIFRAFCGEENVTREEALAMTCALMQVTMQQAREKKRGKDNP